MREPVKGQFHLVAECEYEACPACGGEQLGTCSHGFDEFGDEPSTARPVGPHPGDRLLIAVLGTVIALCVVATLLAAFRLI